MKEKIRSAIRNWARFHHWDSATINDLTDEILKLTQPTEKPNYEAKNKIQKRISDTIKQYIKDEDLIAEIETDLTWLSEFDSIHAYFEKPSAEEWLKENYPTLTEWLQDPFGIAGMYDMIIKAMNQYANFSKWQSNQYSNKNECPNNPDGKHVAVAEGDSYCAFCGKDMLEEPSTITIEKTEGEITITSTGNLGSDPNPNATLKVEKPSAEEWSIEEAERKFEYLLDQYETYVKYETTPIFLKDSVMEAFMNFWEQYAKQ
jgi:hypothetical protein